MAALILLVCLWLLSGFVRAKPHFMAAGSGNQQSSLSGSLILHFRDNNKQHRILYDGSIQGCQTINLPQEYRRMKMNRIEVAHGIFFLFHGRNGKGRRSQLVDSISGYEELSAEQVGFSSVKSVKIGKASFNFPNKGLD